MGSYTKNAHSLDSTLYSYIIYNLVFQDPALSHNAPPQISQIMSFQIEELFGMPQIYFSQKLLVYFFI